MSTENPAPAAEPVAFVLVPLFAGIATVEIHATGMDPAEVAARVRRIAAQHRAAADSFGRVRRGSRNWRERERCRDLAERLDLAAEAPEIRDNGRVTSVPLPATGARS